MRLTAFCFLLSCQLSVVLSAPEIQFGRTKLVGRDIPLLQQEFYGGIPFAKPPVGDLRFRPPVLMKSINASTFDASNFGLACLQEEVDEALMSESCLTINVLRPVVKSKSPLPVMAWIYGGGFTGGSASIYNASAIVGQSVIRGTPVIYVNFNYRLGALGFPQGREAMDNGILNLGLKDQLTALEWIQANIHLFGGDKDKVTVFGESAGAISIGTLFLSPDFKRLARAAIFESGSAGSTLTFKANRPDRQEDWKNLVSAVPACASLSSSSHTLSCLRQKANSSEIFQAMTVASNKSDEQFPWAPNIDGPGGLMPDLPSRLFEKGHFARIPFITGTNLDEGTLFTPTNVVFNDNYIRQILTANMTPTLVGNDQLQTSIDRIIKLYPDVPALGSPLNTGNETFGLDPTYKRGALLFNDLSFQSLRRLWIQAASQHGVKTYGYLFTDPQTTKFPPQFGVTHSAEIVYVYGGVTAPPSSQKLSATMVDYWVSFATSLDPNDGRGTNRTLWPQYTPKHQVLIELNGANTTVIPDDYRKAQIGFLNSNPVTFRHR